MKEKFSYSTVGDLKRVIEELPDDMPIGVQGHFGQLEEIDTEWVLVEDSHPIPSNATWRSAYHSGAPPVKCLMFPFVDIGPDPD